MATGCSKRIKLFRYIVRQGGCAKPIDLRKKRVGRMTEIGEDVDQHLTWLYYSIAETLPDIGDGTEFSDVCLPDDSPCDQVALCAKPMSTSALVPVAGYTDLQSEGGEGKRFLPPGGWQETWLLYRAVRREQGRVYSSFPTFWRISTSPKWKSRLAFRDRHKFAKCNACVKYKELIKKQVLFKFAIYG